MILHDFVHGYRGSSIQVPIRTMDGTLTYIYIKIKPNVGKEAIYWECGIGDISANNHDQNDELIRRKCVCP